MQVSVTLSAIKCYSLILGDVTHVQSKLRYTLKLFQSKFKDVYYCPGNHELWVHSPGEDEELEIDNSVAKFHSVENNERLCFYCIHFLLLS